MAQHLAGARLLLNELLNLSSSGADSDTVGFLAELYLYTASAYRISSNPTWVDLLNDEDSKLYTTNVLAHNRAGFLLGSHQELFPLIHSVASLASERELDQKTLGSCSPQCLSRFHSLRQCILKWSVPAGVTNEQDVLCGELYRQALLVHLETAFRRHDHVLYRRLHLRPFIDRCIGAAMRALRLLPADTPIATITVWPLVILGISARDHQHQEAIQRHLEALFERIKMTSVASSLSLIKNIWESTSEAYVDAWDLEHIMSEKGRVFPLT